MSVTCQMDIKISVMIIEIFTSGIYNEHCANPVLTAFEMSKFTRKSIVFLLIYMCIMTWKLKTATCDLVLTQMWWIYENWFGLNIRILIDKKTAIGHRSFSWTFFIHNNQAKPSLETIYCNIFCDINYDFISTKTLVNLSCIHQFVFTHNLKADIDN